MYENSFLVAFILIIFHIINIIIFVRYNKKNKKQISHYEAIADEHLKKMYDPIIVSIHTIIGLIIASFFLSTKILIIVYLFYNILQNMQAKIIMLIANSDILSLKNSLISMFPNDYNAYFKSWNIDIEITDYIGWGGPEPDKNTKMLLYKINNKVVHSHTINVKDLSPEQINDTILWHKKRFKDYMRYIPKDVFNSSNIQDELDDWFTYLDDVRINF